jgi:adenosine deaminase
MIDLHHHFDGAFDVNELYLEARRRNLPQGKLSETDFAARCRVPADCHTLTQFLAVFEFFYDIAQDLEFLHRAALSLPERLQKEGVIYAETRFAPDLFMGDRYTADEVVEGVLSGLKEAAATPVGLILCVMRNSPIETVENLLTLYEKYQGDGVCGIDLAGDESRFACREYAPIFRRAHEMKIPITIHAGEAAGPQSVRDALDLFHAQRIGHGIRSIEDRDLVERLARDRIGVEVCLTSNLQTGNAASYAAHPFTALRKAGVLVTINTDDPSVSAIDLPHEWAVATSEYGLSKVDKKELLLNSVEVAFCAQPAKDALRALVLAAYAH